MASSVAFESGQGGREGTKTEGGGAMDLLRGSEHVLTYEDKDGDWMLVGDVPWNTKGDGEVQEPEPVEVYPYSRPNGCKMVFNFLKGDESFGVLGIVLSLDLLYLVKAQTSDINGCPHRAMSTPGPLKEGRALATFEFDVEINVAIANPHLHCAYVALRA
ncbi:auxin-responsive protein [Musa troglodytarum]|uniref:Auxin-responsive protein n=1 Tax=Musa troglodytarum TaxID=320322 RepID=A0A9E7F7K2_9LILI|nr:auxin-responsive protein [Musa troglodytarum]